MNQVLQLLKKRAGADNPELLRAVNEKLITIRLGKNEKLLSKGEISDMLYFIDQGIIREYYYSPDKRSEITTQIISAGTFFYSTKAYLTGQPSERYVETVTNSDIFCIKKQDIEDLLLKYPKLMLFINKMMEASLIGYENRLEMMQISNRHEETGGF